MEGMLPQDSTGRTHGSYFSRKGTVMIQNWYDLYMYQLVVTSIMSRKFCENWLKSEGGVAATAFYKNFNSSNSCKKGSIMMLIKHDPCHIVTATS